MTTIPARGFSAPVRTVSVLCSVNNHSHCREASIEACYCQCHLSAQTKLPSWGLTLLGLLYELNRLYVARKSDGVWKNANFDEEFLNITGGLYGRFPGMRDLGDSYVSAWRVLKPIVFKDYWSEREAIEALAEAGIEIEK